MTAAQARTAPGGGLLPAAVGLPRHHVARPRLAARLAQARVAALVAPGGHGKTVLAAEWARSLGVGAAAVVLEPGDRDGLLFARGLRRALMRSGLSDAANAVERAGADATVAVGALVDHLVEQREAIALVVDEIHHLRGADGALRSLVRELPAPHRLLLAGRTLPSSVRGIEEVSDLVLLGPADLAFTPEEAAELVRSLGGPPLGDADAARLVDATGGWAAALVVLAGRLARSGGDAASVLEGPGGRAVLARLLEEQLAHLDEDTVAALVQLAHLPGLDAASAGDVVEDPELLERIAAAGVAVEIRTDGTIDMAGPVRERLAARAPLDAAIARRAADALVERGDTAEAVRTLLAAGEDDAAAACLAAVEVGEAARLDFAELRPLVAAVGPAVDSHPRALLHLARACEAAAEARVRSKVLARARAAASGDAVLEREIDAERARDLVRDGHADEAAVLAERLLAEAGPGELQTRVRALHVLGRTYAWRGDPASLAAAEPLLEEAAELYLRLGYPTGSAHARLGLAYDVHTLGGRFDDAVDSLERALAVLPGRSRLRGVVLAFHAEALVDLGRYDEAEASHAEAERIGRQLGDARTVAFTAWVRARVAARRGDADRVRALLAEAERSRGDWFDHHSGVEFLAEAAVLLDEVGDTAGADAYLARALERADEAPRYVLLARGALAARRGDPAEAEGLLAELAERPDVEVRERWRVALLRAWAAHRAGDEERAGGLAQDAFEHAAATGHPELPFVREPVLAAALRGPADGPAVDGRAVVAVLGGLSIARSGRPESLPPGRPTLLVAFLAVTGGRASADEAIEALWPDVDPASGRKRLRNVLSRLRAATEELVLRDGEVLALADGVEVDAIVFERDAAVALALPDAPDAAGRARAALARYGPLLPDHGYAEWTAEPRERLHARALALLDLLASRAEAEGDVDEAIRLLEQAIELDRLDESRYLRAARLLLAQGRRGRALETLRRSAAALRRLGLEPSAEHRALVREARE